MGTTDPAVFWYPDDAGTLEVLDFGRGLSALYELPDADASDAFGGGGEHYRSFRRGILRVRVTMERISALDSTGQQLVRKIKSLQAHLDKGLPIGLTRRRDKAWAGKTHAAIQRGWSSVHVPGGNAFSAWYSSAALAASDEIVMESANPEALREYNKVSSIVTSGTNTQVNLDNTAVYTLAEDPVVVRYQDFWPVCFLPEDQLGRGIIHPDGGRRLTYTMDLTLEYDGAGVASAMKDRVSPWPLTGNAVTGREGKFSLQRLLGSDAPGWRREFDRDILRGL